MTPTRRGVSYVVIATALLTTWEGVDLVAKHQAIDPPGVITWCHGNTNYDDPTVKPGTRFTKQECADLLQIAIPKYKKPLEKCVKVELTQHQWAALTSASYNSGANAVCKSPMVRNFNAHKPQIACDSFRGWYVRANGKYLQGLANRREAERHVCLTKD